MNTRTATAATRRALPPHGAPADVQDLLGDEAAGLLEAVAGAAGARLLDWRSRQITHHPGRSTTAQYLARLAWDDGSVQSETVIASTAVQDVPDGTAVFEAGGRRVAVWTPRSDPHLPALQAVLDPQRVAPALESVGLPGNAALRLVAYRPGRRAVIEVDDDAGRLFLKVVRPEHAEALHGRHRLLAEHLPVPASAGWSPTGVVLLEARPGATLRAALRGEAPGPLPAPAAIIELLDRLPAALLDAGTPRDLVRDAERLGGVIAAVLPGARHRVRRLLENIGRTVGEPGPPQPVHGDLYEAQLLVSDGRITGLLDVDTAGAGHRMDDLANCCAHLSVLALVDAHHRRINAYGAEVLRAAEAEHRPIELRARIAAAVLGLATGPFRVQEPEWPQRTMARIALAERWLESGRRPRRSR